MIPTVYIDEIEEKILKIFKPYKFNYKTIATILSIILDHLKENVYLKED